MQRASYRFFLSAVAALAATAALAMASPGEDAPPQKRVEIHEISGPGRDVLVTALPGDGFLWRGTTLGVAFVPLTPELRQHFGAPADAGVLVSKVVADSAAQAAGVEVGDIITSLDGKAIDEGFELGRLIRGKKAGDQVALEVLRDGRTQTLTATLQEAATAPMFGRKALLMNCAGEDGEAKDCPSPLIADHAFCGDAEKCEVKVMCKDGACTCTVNGADKACPEGVGHSDGK